MRYSTVLIFVFTSFFISLSAQPILPVNAYIQLSGSISKELALTLYLVKVGDSLYGDYTCFTDSKGNITKFGHNGQSRQCFGKINTNGKFWIKDWPGDQGSIFKGRFTDPGHVSGTWSLKEGGSQKLPFELSKTNKKGCPGFVPYVMMDHCKLLKDQKSPVATIKMGLLSPVKDSSSSWSDTIQKHFFNQFTDSLNIENNPIKLLSKVRQDFFNNYIHDNETLYKEMPGASFGWELLRFTHLISNENGKVTFYTLSYSYTGGAHGLQTQFYCTIDLNRGKVLLPEDIFISGYESELSRLLTSKLHQMVNIPESGQLTESGYFVNEIKQNTNFYMNANGIGFFYNQYEIAPYSFGTTDIFLSTKEVSELLKKP
ncbi:MAG: DUF3298 domain-containing protein [Bacteroidota bacterium]